MPNEEYATAVGFIQFDIDEREANGSAVRDVTIRTPGTPAAGGGALIKATVWPEWKDVELTRGDFVAFDGPIESRESGGKTYLNMKSVKRLKVFGQDTPAEREVVGGKKRSF